MATWVKGQSGNPHGRARRAKSMAEMLRLIAAERVTFVDAGGPDQPALFGGAPDAAQAPEVSTMTRRERLARVLWARALDGDLAAARLIAAYMDGMPVQPSVVGVAAGIRFCGDDLARAAAEVASWRAEALPGWDQGAEDGGQEDGGPLPGG